MKGEFDVETEIELLLQTGKGDRDSFERLYDRYSGVLFSTALRILNDQTLAEDVLQEVFVQIWEKAPTYDPARGKPLTWAVTLTRNKAIDRLRSRQRRIRLGEEVQNEAWTLDEKTDRACIDEVDVREKGAIVRRAIKKLSAGQRQAIELAFFSGLTQSEIAKRLGEPLGTIKARIRRGMLRLRELIESKID